MNLDITDPVELLLAEQLSNLGIPFVHESQRPGQRLDFYLPDQNIFIECKRFHTPRTNDQIMDLTNVVLIQGMEAVVGFCNLLQHRRKDG